jgi:hypothetical protein
MASLTGAASRCLQKTFSQGAVFPLRRFFSSQNPYVGAPEYPIPGSKEYAESMKRLKNSRILTMLSRKPTEQPSIQLEKIQQWMSSISDQNAHLLEEVNRLTHKVEELGSRIPTK